MAMLRLLRLVLQLRAGDRAGNRAQEAMPAHLAAPHIPRGAASQSAQEAAVAVGLGVGVGGAVVLVLVLVLRVVLCRRGVGVRIRGVVVRGLLLLGRRCAGVGWLVGVASLLLLLVVVGRYLLAGLEAVVGGRAVLVLWRAVVLLAAIVVLLLAGLLLGWVAGLLVGQ